MRLSDNKRAKETFKAPARRAVKADMKHWSDGQKLEAVKLWMVTGNLTQSAAALSIPLATIKRWRATDWWADLVNELKSEDSIKLSNRLKVIANKALDLTEDRLENGDHVFHPKTGEMVRKELPARDLSNLVKTTLDQAKHIEDRPQKLEQDATVQQTLDKLQSMFEDFAKKSQKPTVQVTDVVFAKEDT
ncbi:hypothetical protein [uncultured Paraglaciecola sp.]|uniref:hypothetical protein n=1 Tax=uncultured Paraglaciecola sp. TaxID=1765024 RepID=UPI0026393F3D|nr:hypothetical protein [uncultured Paraglaciecola sp.]